MAPHAAASSHTYQPRKTIFFMWYVFVTLATLHRVYIRRLFQDLNQSTKAPKLHLNTVVRIIYCLKLKYADGIQHGRAVAHNGTVLGHRSEVTGPTDILLTTPPSANHQSASIIRSHNCSNELCQQLAEGQEKSSGCVCVYAHSRP